MAIQQFLEPVAADNPCGEDLSYDPAFLDLQTKVKGKEETQFSPAEDPNWKEVKNDTLDLMNRSRDIRLGVVFALALLMTEGLPGFRDGLALLREWLSRFWESLYPRLDPGDNNDPTERINILQGISVRTFGDPFRFLDRLSEAPLCESRSLGRFSLKSIQAVKDNKSAGDSSSNPAAGPGQITAAFQDTDPAWLQSGFQAADESLQCLKQIDELLLGYVGPTRMPNFEVLEQVLKEIRNQFIPHLKSDVPGAAESSESAGSGSGTGTVGRAQPGGLAIKSAIESREEVITVLKLVCEYYRRCEPSSPVPLLLERAQKLVNLDFFEIVNNLAPDSLSQIQLIVGKREEPTASS